MAEKSNAEVGVAAAAEEEQAQPDAKVIPNPPALPMPQFTSEMGYTKDSKIPCFWPACDIHRKGYWSSLCHVKDKHTGGKIPMEWRSSYFVMADLADVIMLGFLTQWTKTCSQERTGAAAQKYSEDAKLIENFHSPRFTVRIP